MPSDHGPPHTGRSPVVPTSDESLRRENSIEADDEDVSLHYHQIEDESLERANEREHLLGGSNTGLESQRLHERTEEDRRKVIESFLRGISLFSIVLLAFGLTVLYMKLSGDLDSWKWSQVFSSGWCISVMFLFRGILKLAIYSNAQHNNSLGVADKHTVESAIYGICLSIGFAISLGLGAARLDGLQTFSGIIISLSVIIPIIGYIVWGLYVVIDPFNSSLGRVDPEETIRKTKLRIQMVINGLNVSTLILVALKVDGSFDLSWFLILSWPIIVTSFWLLSCLGLGLLNASWVYWVLKGNTAQLDALLADITNVSHVSTWFRTKVIVTLTFCVVSLCTIVLTILFSEFFLIRLLENVDIDSGKAIDRVFIPLIFASSLSLLLAGVLEVAVLPHLQWFATGSESLFEIRQVDKNGLTLGPGGYPVFIKGCASCRQMISQIVRVDSPNVYIYEDSKPEKEDKHPDPTDIKSLENDSNDDTNTFPNCSVCYVNSSNAVFLPCGHGGVCVDCAYRWAFGASKKIVEEKIRELQSRSNPDRTDSNRNYVPVVDVFGGISPVQTPLYLVRQSSTFFRASRTKPDPQRHVPSSGASSSLCRH